MADDRAELAHRVGIADRELAAMIDSWVESRDGRRSPLSGRVKKNIRKALRSGDAAYEDAVARMVLGREGLPLSITLPLQTIWSLLCDLLTEKSQRQRGELDESTVERYRAANRARRHICELAELLPPNRPDAQEVAQANGRCGACGAPLLTRERSRGYCSDACREAAKQRRRARQKRSSAASPPKEA